MLDQYQSIYVNYKEFKELPVKTQELFNQLFLGLLLDGKKTYTNRYLADLRGESVSSVEKRFKQLREAKLIIQKVSSFLEGNKWHTVRTFELDPLILSRLRYDVKKLCK